MQPDTHVALGSGVIIPIYKKIEKKMFFWPWNRLPTITRKFTLHTRNKSWWC